MHIGFVADTYKPYTSGVTHYIALNKQVLEKMGHIVSVFSFGDPRFDPGEANVVTTRGLVLPNGYAFGLSFSPIARRAMRQVDILHANHPFASGAAAQREARRANIPIVFTNHTRYDLYMRAYLPFLPPALGRAYLTTVLPRYCRSVDRVIAPSAGLAEVLRGLKVDAPLKVIPNGIDVAHFAGGDPSGWRERLGVSTGDVLLVFVGRLSKEKNVRLLVEAFAAAASACPRAHLVLAGGGNEKAALEAIAIRAGVAGRIHFTGPLSYDQVSNLLAAADAFVTASVSEVHPLTVIEALAAGLPVVGIHSPGVSDTIRHGWNGLLAGDTQPKNLTAQIIEICRSDEARANLSAAARQSAQEYAIERTAGLLLDEYRSVIAARRA